MSIESFLDNSSSTFSIVIKDSTIYSFIRSRSLVYTLRFDSDFKISKVDSLNFGKYYDKEDIYIKEDIDQPYQVIGNTFFFPIGSLSKRKKFVNDKAYLAVNINNGKVKINHVLPSPQEYVNGLRESMVTFIYSTKINEAALLFQDIDRIVLFNTADMNVIESNDFNPYSNFESYNYDQRKDLGYLRIYAETNEVNFKIVPLNGKIVIIKKARSKNIHEKRVYEYLVLNDKNKLVHYDSIEYAINPFLSFPYRNGFVLVDHNLLDGYYYETI